MNTQALSCKLQCLLLSKIIFIVLCSQTQSRITKYLSKASHMKKSLEKKKRYIARGKGKNSIFHSDMKRYFTHKRNIGCYKNIWKTRESL